MNIKILDKCSVCGRKRFEKINKEPLWRSDIIIQNFITKDTEIRKKKYNNF